MSYHTRLLAPVVTLLSSTALAQPANIEEILVIGVQDTHTVRTDDTMVAPADTAELLKKMPGANINKNGELTGIAQYRGMFGDRVNVSINGAHVSSGGPNAMDAPLHYAPVALIESLSISRGIVPVSAGQETIGGHVHAETYSGDFGNSTEWQLAGRTYLGGQSVNNGSVGSALLSLTNRNHILRAFLMKERGDDSEFHDGRITPSNYDRDRWDAGYSYQRGNHEFSFDFARNNTLDSGTAALPMDINSLDSELLRSRYQWSNLDYTFTAEYSLNDIRHWMSNYHLRRPPLNAQGNPDLARFRNTYTSSDNSGLVLKLEKDVDNGLWRAGVDSHFSEHLALILNPNAAAFFTDNFKDIERNVIGAFIEREMSLSSNTGLEIGVRYNRVTSDSGAVDVNLNPANLSAGMPFQMNNMAHTLAAQFNAKDLSQSDGNTDWFARFSIDTSYDVTWYVGAARKSRSPSYQERYLWMPASSAGGLADGKIYMGDPDLKPEVAHEMEVGFDMNRGRFTFYPRAFYKEVTDFIQGVPSTNTLANTLAQMLANAGMGSPNPLQFANVDASYYGFDMESSYELSDRLTLRSVLSIVRGQREDIRDDLYRISPDNMILSLDYTKNNWTASLESMTYADQERVSNTNLEAQTDGYTIVNLTGRINVSPDIELGMGVNNLLDKEYEDHLAAYNRAWNPDVAIGDRLPGLGRSVYARMMWYF
ncbi:MAG: TonB-dependent receptor [Gammaproteobacteria bacterium]|nr:TonB-dependent receptor [Gammaproteobacteria bacterium]